jgi:tetratricopeptide (TPR) repeat protein
MNPRTPVKKTPYQKPTQTIQTSLQRVRYVLMVVVLALLVGISCPALASPTNDEVNEIYEYFNAWQFDAAKSAVGALEAASPGDPMVLMLQAQVAFYEGKYTVALAQIDTALKTSPPSDLKDALVDLRQLVSDTHEVSQDYQVITSESGRFEVRFPKGKDAILPPYAFETLDAAYDAMAADFGVTPSLPVRIEIYPSAEDLAAVSPLTVEDIQTSGTIALCKYNRLMITSPLALARGYGWLDTLTHEYVHMIINIAGKGRVPIWLHEGLAKFSERRWRGGDNQRHISPYSEYILHKRANEGKIVTFDQMHPSMAKLPSQEDAAMAFAEVYAAMELIHLEKGTAGLGALVKLVGDGVGVGEAVAQVMGLPTFEAFIVKWESHLKTRTRRYLGDEPPDVYEQVSFRKSASVGDQDDLMLIPEQQAREWVHLGELLRAKGKHAAAAIEYRKASNVLGPSNPILQARLGRSLLDAGHAEQAAAEMRKAEGEAEAYATLFVYLGEALLAGGKLAEAEAALKQAVAHNPYDPAIHQALARVYDALGNGPKANQARAHLAILSSGSSE